MPRSFSGETSCNHSSGFLAIELLSFAAWNLSPPSYNADVKAGAQTQAMRYAVVIAAIAIITVIDFRLHVNHTTVALMFLVAVLLASAYWGLRYALVLAVGATAAFNFFFLPPVGTFTIADPQNWVALF